jgi:hypothetical protein
MHWRRHGYKRSRQKQTDHVRRGYYLDDLTGEHLFVPGTAPCLSIALIDAECIDPGQEWAVELCERSDAAACIESPEQTADHAICKI